MERLPALRIALPLLLAAACASPSPRFTGAERMSMQVGGYDYEVFLRPDEAQVIRTDRVWLPDRDEVMAGGVLAAERASGCRAKPGATTGDAAIMTVPLSCPR